MSEAAKAIIGQIAEAAIAIGWQAGVGQMETAGSIISYLAAHPEQIEAFLSGGSVLDWPPGWHEQGCLSWHGMDGKLHFPEEARRQRVIRQMERDGNSSAQGTA